MTLKKTLSLYLISFLCGVISVAAQQIEIPRINLMPYKPTPFLIRDWKQVTLNYDNYVFDTNKTGTNLPLTNINMAAGTNYSSVQHIRMDTYVGQANHGRVAEAINILPAMVGASLVGVDKTNHLGINWVSKVKDFYNLKNGHHIYLNGYSSGTGHDWWYEIMPNVFFYQLYALYPDADADFSTQFLSIADRQLEVLFKLGAKLHPWTAPFMNYRAFNLISGLPNASSVPEPESAGSIAWLLYQAYIETQEIKYLQGAELALDFLQSWETNPSYEIQLPYGILTAARMNAVEGTNYNIEKMLNWAFSSGKGTLRGWGAIVGNWNGYDVSGLIGEANDAGNDYAFIMNGFQHAAALVPLVKYDKRYANAIGKWMLNLTNASRLFYPNALPIDHMHPSGINWARQYNTDFSIPYESMKEMASGKSPYATGDAVRGGWASTNLSLYSGSSVGYLASMIEKTNVESILQIDLNKTDFRGDNIFPTYLYYNPETTDQTVKLHLPGGTFNIYDAIDESLIKTEVSGLIEFCIDPRSSRILVIIPSSKNLQASGRFYQTTEGEIVDYHYAYDYANTLRIKAFTSNTRLVECDKAVSFHCLTENPTGNTHYKWYQDETIVHETHEPSFEWVAPDVTGLYNIRCEVTDEQTTVLSPNITVRVVSEGEVPPKINDLVLFGSEPYSGGEIVSLHADITPAVADFNWTVDGGSLENAETLSPSWTLPVTPGIYTIQLTVSNHLGDTTTSHRILVKDKDLEVLPANILAYYPFNGDTRNYARDDFHAISYNANSTKDARGNLDHAYAFSSSSQYIKVPNHDALNFTSQIALSFWIKPEQFPGYEQYVVSHGSYEERYKMSITPEKRMRWTLKTSNQIVDVDDETPLQAGEFTHYVGIYTGYSLELYKNGDLVSYKPLSGAIGTTSKSITIARKDERETQYNFLGTVDELRIYNSDLPASYIKLLPSMWDLSSGTQHAIAHQSINIHPNPFKTFFKIDCSTGDLIQILELINLQGQTIFTKRNPSNQTTILLDEQLSPGPYLLRITTDDEVQVVKKLIKLE
ncbi:MAG: LamG-like jellyroll fold domain-containing protein [Paludibacter sp.]|jgi:PKD repeat protein